MQKLYGILSSNYLIYQDILKSAFITFLTANGASTKTQKNYWSDVQDFVSWFIAASMPVGEHRNNHPRLLFQALSRNHIEQYVQHLARQKISGATINRRLSSLRMFFSCCLEMMWLSYHPMEGIANIKTARPVGLARHTSLLEQFEDHLHGLHVGKATIKNYVSDVRRFLPCL